MRATAPVHRDDVYAAATPSCERPLDLVHLARQTMGDRGLEQEVLALFANQLDAARRSLSSADPQQLMRLAHGLKGAARGVGAFPVAARAEELEAAPGDVGRLAQLQAAISEARLFISRMSD